MLRWQANLAKAIGLFLFLLILPGNVLALDANSYNILDTPFYDPTNTTNCTVNVDINLSGNDAAQKAYNFFISKNLTPAQAAGVVANIYYESGGIVPTKVQNPPGGSSQDPAAAGGNGWGIVQWTPANTKVPGILRDANINTPVYELGTQLNMVWAQLTGQAGGYSEKQAGDDVKSTTNILDAVLAFQGNDSPTAGQYRGHFHGFERPKSESDSVPARLALANQFLAKYGGGSANQTVQTAASACSSSGPGQDTQYVDGFTVYTQYDPAWGDKSYGSSTIAAAGCGPTSMAMIITNLTKQQVTPDETAAYADSQGLYVAGVGSSWSIAPVLAAHWGLSAQQLRSDVSQINASLQAGGLVILSGEGPLPFTSGGHYIVIRGLTADGKWKIGDPAHSDANTQTRDPQTLLSYANTGSIYAISNQ